MTQYSGKVIRKTPVTPTQQSASGVWTTAQQAAAIRNNSWPVPGVPDPISRSLRFRASATAYLNRTFGTPTNNLKWTWSGWVKLGAFPSSGYGRALFSGGAADSGNNTTGVFLNTSNQLYLNAYSGGSNQARPITDAVYRDPSAWYHVVCVYDSANATQADRFIFYVNGVRQSVTGTLLSLNLASKNNASGVLNRIGMEDWGTSYGFDGYMTEVNFIDGQALTPSSFGTTDASSGAWIPMPYTGTYGANGFYLNFKDNTSTTTLGYDYSGNANNWATNNISLTSGTTYDSMIDVPTLWVGYNTGDTSGVTRGNYPTMNPLGVYGSMTFINANTTGSSTSSNVRGYSTIVLPSTGKWYLEFTEGSSGYQGDFGLLDYTYILANPSSIDYTYGKTIYSGYYFLRQAATAYTGGGSVTDGTSLGFAVQSIKALAIDMDAGRVYFIPNSSGFTNSAYLTFDNTRQWVIGGQRTTTFTGIPFDFIVNFGQRPLSYTPPSGYKTLVTTNLTTPAVTNGANYFAASLWTGTGSARSIVNSGNNAGAVSFQPDFVWVKSRTQAIAHRLVDSVRGATLTLSSNLTNAEYTDSQGVTSFNSNGFGIGTDTSYNQSADTYVGWNWKAGGAAVSNTSGTITSSVSANTTAGFSVVTYTGNGTNGATFGHGLGVAPSLVIGKCRSTVEDWPVYHASLSAGYNLRLNATNGQFTYSSTTSGGIASVSSSVVTTGQGASTNGAMNANGATYVAYCFAAVAGYSAFGSYTGNGSTDGPFVYCGFRPRWIMVKVTNTTGYWMVYDTSRDTYNVVGNFLEPNSSVAEVAASPLLDVLANGFKFRSANGVQNDAGNTYIYAAFAENPFKYSNAR